MRPDEAKHLAEKIRLIKGIRVHGMKSSGKWEGDKMLVFSYREREHHISQYEQALGKIAKLTGVKGHVFESLNVCSLCYGDLRANDGHYHSIRSRYGPGASEGICCTCLLANAGECRIKLMAPPPEPTLGSVLQKWDQRKFRKLLKQNKAGAKKLVIHWIRAGKQERAKMARSLDRGLVSDLNALAKKLLENRKSSKS